MPSERVRFRVVVGVLPLAFGQKAVSLGAAEQAMTALETAEQMFKNLGNSTKKGVQSILFRSSVTDLVRGLRNNKKSESKFISSAIQGIKEELQSTEYEDKVNALQKLVYLNMFGYDMGWAAFRMIEVISRPKFSWKRVGYLATSQCFNESTDVILLATNLIRKDCMSHQMYDAGIAINCLANICTTELARDLVPDIVSMVTSARPYTRKKAVLVLYKIFLRFPDALRPTFPRLREKLEDPNPSAVNVICELARKNAKNYLPLAPTLFKLMTKSTNNWILIKIIKLFAVLCPLEQRLAKKLAQPLSNIINSSNAMSLLYEAISCCIVGLNQFPNVMRLCVTKLRTFVEHPDPNLKYLGLLALSKVMKVFPRGVVEHRDLIINCLEDDDMTIRSRALDLVSGMVDKKNISFIVDKLKVYLDASEEPEYRSELLEAVINICSQERYKFVTDFEWYIGVLLDLTQYKDCNNYHLIRDQLIDVCVRVAAVREYGVESSQIMLEDNLLFSQEGEGAMSEPLYAAAWIIGEYSSSTSLKTLRLLTRPLVLQLPAHIQSMLLQAAFKQLVTLGKTSGAADKLPSAISLLRTNLKVFTTASDLEVQERACFITEMLTVVEEDADNAVTILAELAEIYGEALNPVSALAQSRVKVPEGLDLDAWIHEPLHIEEPANDSFFPEEEQEEQWSGIGPGGYGGYGGTGDSTVGFNRNTGGIGSDNGQFSGFSSRKLDENEIRRRQALRRQQNAGNMFFITEDEDVSGIPPLRTLPIDGSTASELRGALQGGQRGGRGRGGRGARGARGGRPRRVAAPVQLAEDENPDDWDGTDKSHMEPRKKDALSAVNFDDEDGDVSILQHQTHRVVSAGPSPAKQSSSAEQVSGRGRRGARGVRGANPRSRGGRGGRGAGRGGRGGARLRPGAPSGKASVPFVPPRMPVVIGKDDNVLVQVVLNASRKTKDELTAVFTLKNLRPKPNSEEKDEKDKKEKVEKDEKDDTEETNEEGEESKEVEVESVPANVVGSLSVHLRGNLKTQVVVDGAKLQEVTLPLPNVAIPAGEAREHSMQISVESQVEPDALKGFVSYKLKDTEDELQIPFTLDIPCSAFVLPPLRAMDAPALYQLLRTKATETKTGRVAGPLDKACEALSKTFHVQVIERAAGKASLFGVNLAGNSVAFLVKADGAEKGPVAVAVKTDSALLSANLQAELPKL